MTPYSILVSYAGLSHREASKFHNVRIDTVKSWSSGRNRAPDGAIKELCELIERQEASADETLIQIKKMIERHGAPETIEIGYPADDYEAHTLDWPCVNAWAAMAARVISASPIPTRLVPRGSTTATAAAADAHKK